MPYRIEVREIGDKEGKNIDNEVYSQVVDDVDLHAVIEAVNRGAKLKKIKELEDEYSNGADRHMWDAKEMRGKISTEDPTEIKINDK